jgi:hypothetical protein
MNYSTNDKAEQVMGRRPTDGVSIDSPAELGYICPLDGNDAIIEWSEYNGFIWCAKCNKDYPVDMCMPGIDKSIDVFLATVAHAKSDAIQKIAFYFGLPEKDIWKVMEGK